MRTAVFQHVPFELLGSIESWILQSTDAEPSDITYHHLYKDDPLPSPEDLDLLVVLGGPMGVYETKEYPWLTEEYKCIEEIYNAEKKIFGICLGAQLIAHAFGAEVRSHHEPEIGWFPIRRVGSRDEHLNLFPEEFLSFHWHGDTYDLPSGAVHIAESVGCEQQAYRIGTQVLALQFHLEMTSAGAEALLENTPELPTGDYVQEREVIAGIPERFQEIETLGNEMFRQWIIL